MRIRTNSSAQDSRIPLSPGEWTICIFIYIMITVSAAWLFYDSCVAVFVFAPLFPVFIRAFRKYKDRKHKEEMSDEFIRSLISVSASLAAGVSPENAFVAAESDMGKLYGKKAVIVKELGVVNTRVKLGIRIQDALFDLAQRYGIEEIYDFAVVFAVAVEKGADFTAVIASCVEIMENKRTAEQEAAVLIRAKQYEQRVMCLIPPAILAYLRVSSGSFTEVLYHSPAGIIIMSACLAVYVLAIYLAERIGDIRV